MNWNSLVSFANVGYCVRVRRTYQHEGNCVTWNINFCIGVVHSFKLIKYVVLFLSTMVNLLNNTFMVFDQTNKTFRLPSHKTCHWICHREGKDPSIMKIIILADLIYSCPQQLHMHCCGLWIPVLKYLLFRSCDDLVST